MRNRVADDHKETIMQRRQLLFQSIAGAAAWALGTAWAQSDKTIKIIVPFAPGGGNDVFARQIAKSLGELRNQAIVVENKPGAGGNLGTEQVVRAAADGTTLLLGHTGTISINPALYKGLKFDPRADLQPVASFASSALVLVVAASSPVKTVADLLASGRAKPGTLNYASGGAGTGAHLTGELFEQKSGVKLTHIPYKGTVPGLTDVAGGQVQFCFSVIPPALALIKSGKLRAIGVTSLKRLPSLPDVPTLAESGIAQLAGFESTLTYGIFAPRATPEAQVRELAAQIVKVAATPEFQARLEVDGAVPLLNNATDYAALVKAENAKWAEIVKTSGATAD